MKVNADVKRRQPFFYFQKYYLSGLGNPIKDAGVIKQLSLKYPNLEIEVTSEIAEGANVNGRLAFKVKDGAYIDQE